MKIWKYVIAIMLLAVATVGILEAVNVIPPIDSIIGAISAPAIIGAVLVFALFLRYLMQGKICRMILCLTGLFLILEPNIAYLCKAPSADLIDNWQLIFYTVLACIGLWLILPKRRRKLFKKKSVSYQKSGLGARTIYIDSTDFTTQHIENNLGSSSIRFENVANYHGGGTLYLENSLGSMHICIPVTWRLDCQIENNLASVRNYAGVLANGPLLTIRGENNLGSIVIQRY